MKEIIYLRVRVEIRYPNKKARKEIIKEAIEGATGMSVWSSDGTSYEMTSAAEIKKEVA